MGMFKNYLLVFVILSAITSCSHLKEFPNEQDDYMIIPQVTSLQMEEGRFSIDGNTGISWDSALDSEGNYLMALLGETSGMDFSTHNQKVANILLSIDTTLTNPEEYRLVVESDKISIAGNSSNAVFYGIQTLRQLIQPENSERGLSSCTIPCAIIKDSPRFTYRGMHLDVSRHYFSVDFIKRYIDLLAMHKMNTFHWHLTDDQGWRIEIKKYPELTNVGAWRNGTIEGHFPGTKNDNIRTGGYYTQEEVKEVITYASLRHITIIPEIELPGHSSAAIAAYPFLSCFPEEPTVVPNNLMSEASSKIQEDGKPKIVQETWGVFDDVYCAGKEETFIFIENVLKEVMDLFPSTYIHVGGDECPKKNWERCSNCQDRMHALGLENEHQLQSYFINRIEKFVNNNGKNIIGWDEILEGGLAPNATVMSWRGNTGGVEASRADHTVIMTPNSHCYFDHYQSANKENEPLAIGGLLSVEKVYTFDPVPVELEADKQQYILGGQANLWTEYIASEEYAEYMLLPRLTALSEVLWTSKDALDWNGFLIRLEHFRYRYDELNLNYGKHVFHLSK